MWLTVNIHIFTKNKSIGNGLSIPQSYKNRLMSDSHSIMLGSKLISFASKNKTYKLYYFDSKTKLNVDKKIFWAIDF